MSTRTEAPRAAEFILSEANGQLSRENVVILGGTGGAGKLEAGTVLGKLTSGGKYVGSPASGSDGSQAGIAVLIYPVDASDDDVVAAVIARVAEVKGDFLVYDASVDTDNEKLAKAAQLAALEIIVR